MTYTRILGLAALMACAACKRDQPTPSPQPAQEAPKPVHTAPPPAAAIAHGGVGSPPEWADGCRKAVDAALAVLERGGDPLDAAVAGGVVLEDDPRFNAGTGSRVRIDGETVQMDASVMRSGGQFGAVAIIEAVQNPVRVAQAVLDTPHILIAGDGATQFARSLGIPVYDPATEERKQQTADIIAKLRRADDELPESWQGFDWRARWNFEATLEKAGLTQDDMGADTVGVAVRGADGSFAVALSTGGTAITLRGRVGDVPILGAGLYAGPNGAVAATGTGERIVEATLSRRVYDWMSEDDPATATQRGVDEIRDKGAIGLISITADRMAAAADRPMAWAGRELGKDDWAGPDPAAP
ncbi:isoaspartyl peptidase/L-asparaginase [Haliangium ochraceum]|uniref:Peptidase T2 asparaginase 2 n=1 Tax=Haliangium ochraceum (strain DSM 14365 / JCM 11303 / SMP-2) TaxID=502025 RepID=D0LMX9_HALO1|nr:isoaspartyl peptidase/L-asparaginase [Haliangium ochraceum]ACY13350.1 peptidase T2 asparaginase 2 [Haliangium ochraceum DSM 14365]